MGCVCLREVSVSGGCNCAGFSFEQDVAKGYMRTQGVAALPEPDLQPTTEGNAPPEEYDDTAASELEPSLPLTTSTDNNKEVV